MKLLSNVWWLFIDMLYNVHVLCKYHIHFNLMSCLQHVMNWLLVRFWLAGGHMINISLHNHVHVCLHSLPVILSEQDFIVDTRDIHLDLSIMFTNLVWNDQQSFYLHHFHVHYNYLSRSFLCMSNFDPLLHYWVTI